MSRLGPNDVKHNGVHLRILNVLWYNPAADNSIMQHTYAYSVTLLDGVETSFHIHATQSCFNWCRLAAHEVMSWRQGLQTHSHSWRTLLQLPSLNQGNHTTQRTMKGDLPAGEPPLLQSGRAAIQTTQHKHAVFE